MTIRKNLVGERFGRLTVIAPAEDFIRKDGRHRARWLCRCDCGNEKVVYGENLTRNVTKSCGCLQKERASETKTVHGDTDSRLYGVWCAIKRRCFNEEDPAYHRYGGRGIIMCEEWKNDYSSFREWALNHGYDINALRGECTIDRIDNDKGYYPDNCRWTDQKTQMSNVSYNHYETYNGETHTIAEWARKYNMPYSKLFQRVSYYGYTMEEALNKK